MKMAELRVLPPAARFFKKLKDKKLKSLYREAIDKIKASSVICFVKNQRDLNRNPILGVNAMADFSNRQVKMLERSIIGRQTQ